MPRKRKTQERGPVLAVFQNAAPDFKMQDKVASCHDWCQLPKMETLKEFVARRWVDGYMDNRYMTGFIFDGTSGELVSYDEKIDDWIQQHLSLTGGRCTHPGCHD